MHMMYGFLIGLILASLYLIGSNSGVSTSPQITIIRGIVRAISYMILLPSMGALIGLIIRGS
jgi:hypothetical protein